MAAALLLVVGLGETRRTTRILCDVEHNTELCLLALISLGFVQEGALMEITFHVQLQLNFKEKTLRWSPESCFCLYPQLCSWRKGFTSTGIKLLTLNTVV